MQTDRIGNGRRRPDDSFLHNLSAEGVRRFEALQEEYPIIRQLRFIAFAGTEVSEKDVLDAFEQMAKGAQARTRAARRHRG